MKLGLYIIPLPFCYTPILFEGPVWQTIETAVAGLVGLYFFASFFEGFHLGPLTWPQRLGYAGIAFCLLWPSLLAHAAGGAGMIVAVLVEKAVLGRRAARAVAQE